MGKVTLFVKHDLVLLLAHLSHSATSKNIMIALTPGSFLLRIKDLNWFSRPYNVLKLD